LDYELYQIFSKYTLCLVPAFNTLAIIRMTSVLNAGGLNYQNGNPVRLGIEANRNEISELRKVVEGLSTEISIVKSRLATAERSVAEAKAAAAEAKTSALEAKATIAAAAISATTVTPS
jgi:hypothetical protein